MFWLWKRSRKDDWDISNYEKVFNKLSRNIVKNEREVILFKKAFSKNKRFYRYLLLILLTTINLYYHYVLRNKGVFLLKYSSPTGLVITLICLVIWYLYNMLAVFYYNIKISRYLTTIRSDKLSFNLRISNLKHKMNFEKIQQILNTYEKQIYNVDANDVNNSDSYDNEVELERLEKSFDEAEKLKRKRILIQKGLYSGQDQDESIGGFFSPSKILNVLLGKDETSASNRYALICVNCFTNNGLAPPRMLPNKVKFKCVSCGTMNNSQQDSNVGAIIHADRRPETAEIQK